QTSQSTASRPRGTTNEQVQYRNDLLRNATNLINSPEQYDDEIQATEEIVKRLNLWRRLAREAPQGGPLKPEIPGRDSDITGAETSSGTTQEQLLNTLPEKLISSRWVRHLSDDAFDAAIDNTLLHASYDGTFLREAALLRDVASRIEPASLDDVSIASAIF